MRNVYGMERQCSVTVSSFAVILMVRVPGDEFSGTGKRNPESYGAFFLPVLGLLHSSLEDLKKIHGSVP